VIYDLIVIGGGPAGYLACERAGHEGLKVLLLEKEHVGGVCLNKGCIPTKTLLYSAKVKDSAEHGEKYGITGNIALNHRIVLKRKNKIVKKLTASVRQSVKSAGCDILDTEGIIRGRGSNGYEVEADGQTYTAKRLLIATGSLPAIPPIEGLEAGLGAGFVVTSTELLDIQEIPKRLTVIGGGVVGMEMASYFNSAGSDVTVIEMLPRIGGNIDKEIAGLLQKEYESKGVRFIMEASVTGIGDGSVRYRKGDEAGEIKADKVLLSAGRKPQTKGIGLENIGVSLSRRGIEIDHHCLTSVPNVYAAGDVTGLSMLAHMAYRQAEAAVNHMLGRTDTMRYDVIPSVLYTNPEVAAVGETARSAKDKGMDITERTVSMNYSGRYMAENEGGGGICKIVVDKKLNTLCGVHIIGNYASEIIVSAGICIEKMLTIDEIKRIVFPHPTVSEVIREAIYQV
jgi:dihydrolipoamide dehydrogenase